LQKLLAKLDIADVLATAGFSGLELRQVRSYRDNPMPWWQVLAPYAMPRMSAETWAIVLSETDHIVRPDFIIRATPPCPECRRDGRYNSAKEPLQFACSRTEVDLKTLPDFIQTWECFGRSVLQDDPERRLKQSIAQPLFLVKPTVLNLLLQQKLRKRAAFVPVRIVD